MKSAFPSSLQLTFLQPAQTGLSPEHLCKNQEEGKEGDLVSSSSEARGEEVKQGSPAFAS